MLTLPLRRYEDPQSPARETIGMTMSWSAKRAMIGERSRPMPPTPTPGITRRIGPRTGSVSAYTKRYTAANGESGEIGNQLRMTRTKMTAMYACKSQEMGCDTGVAEFSGAVEAALLETSLLLG